VTQIVSRANSEDLMLFYNLPAFANNDTEAFLRTLARVERLTKKVIDHRHNTFFPTLTCSQQGGELDLTSAARVLLRDWSTGKLPRYAAPPKVDADAALPIPTPDAAPAQDGVAYADDAATLAHVPTRADRRRGAGLVRLAAGALEARAVPIDAPWAGGDAGDDMDGHDDAEDADAADAAGDEDEAEEDVDDEDADVDELGVDEDEDEDEEDEEEVAPAPAPGKR
jgi:nuclear GTP-binding protein